MFSSSSSKTCFLVLLFFAAINVSCKKNHLVSADTEILTIETLPETVALVREKLEFLPDLKGRQFEVIMSSRDMTVYALKGWNSGSGMELNEPKQISGDFIRYPINFPNVAECRFRVLKGRFAGELSRPEGENLTLVNCLSGASKDILVIRGIKGEYVSRLQITCGEMVLEIYESSGPYNEAKLNNLAFTRAVLAALEQELKSR